ncbi:MAG: (d)CMP kinase [Flavobacteriales bacterium]
MKKITIAIDGYSSCGKSTIAKDLANRLDYIYIDTGAMYRAVTLYLLQNNIITKDGKEIYKMEEFLDEISITFQCDPKTKKCEIFLNGENVEADIRNLLIANNVSFVASFKEVREKLVSIQRELGKSKGVVMDGRDIGTVVFPDAELKLFVTSDTEIRAKRRYNELRGKGEKVSLDDVKANLEKRDYIDSHRKESPLTQAQDAVIIDTSHLTREEQTDVAYELVMERVRKTL